MEYEQRGVSEHEIAFLKLLNGARGNHGIEMGLGVATKCVAAMRLAKVKKP